MKLSDFNAPKGWFDKFSRTEKVKICKHNPKISEIVKELKNKLTEILGEKTEIEHRGASALCISGKGEVDFYVRVSKKQFKPYLKKLVKILGKPGRLDPYRARFNYKNKGIEFEIILIYKNSNDEISGRIFFNYLKSHPKALKEYEKIKKKYAKISEREYYLQKDKFIKKILLKEIKKR